MVPVNLIQGEEQMLRRGIEEVEAVGEGILQVPLTSLSFAARPCCPSPACGWYAPALWQCRPAARTLWRAAHSCPEEPPAASIGTVT